MSATVTLYTYFRSSCSARLRIALHLKGIPFTPVFVNLLKDEQSSPAHRAINPSGTVPALIIQRDSSTPVTITQSLAALEYLQEAFLDMGPSLLPQDPEERALVRTLASIIACDVQPVTNLRILKRVAPLGADRAAWSKELIEDGLRAYETIVASSAGKFSVGDQITIADICLIPAAWGAERVGVDLKAFPITSKIVQNLEQEEAVRKGHWQTQPDTPEDLRAK
ncbi:Maleylacetoacetate isomerase [Penicillium macrosclerotiorum]|uniref:Maleylacetoacetate isomerase n=1 Tax=Penicillium macrosclerotiorum TaxID=303699 RepID=UPI002548BE01|nr:Maleylacetoacetate isomerase [Penicillium macrosclerotiorum]KAJ5669615.1 Maleylacetoacetate isomerase [Penicillium macrosclerotiorum]